MTIEDAYARYNRKLLNTARSRMSYTLADDVVAQVWCTAVRRWDRIRGGQANSNIAFLHTVLRNTSVDLRRKPFDPLPVAMLRRTDGAAGARQIVDRLITAEILEKLTPRQARLARLAWMDGMSPEELTAAGYFPSRRAVSQALWKLKRIILAQGRD